MKHFLFLFFTAGAFLLLNSCNSEENLPPPNILWIVSEDNSPFIGAYGDTFATTPTLDSLAKVSVLYTHAFATTPVCAPSRSTLITSMYANSLGTLPMRSVYPIPAHMRFFPSYLRNAGYYCTNNSKKDYNTVDQPETWDESSNKATYLNRPEGKPFFHVQNIFITHESQVHDSIPWGELRHDPAQVPIPPYHPRTKDMEHDWAQYYDRMQQMDAEVKKFLDQLRREGLAENTIVFYYSDHGGVLGRSKRFMYESGLRVPLIVHFPEKYRHLAPSGPGASSSRIVNFSDFGPTVLSLAGIPVPEHMQGIPFLGSQQGKPRQYSPAYRGRMDERLDLVRSVRNERFRYIRNFMPHLPNGQHIEYLWQARSMPSWEKAYQNGELNEVQQAFWLPRPSEELYDVAADPHNIYNLAEDSHYQDVLLELRTELFRWLLEVRDVGFIPEPMVAEISKMQPPFDYVRGKDFPIDMIIETADIASRRDSLLLPEIINRLDHPHPVVRYWAAKGVLILNGRSADARQKLVALTADNEASVRIAAAEALYNAGEKRKAVETCADALQSDNVFTRLYAANALDGMGTDTHAAVGALKTSMADSIGQSISEYPKAAGWIVKRLEE